jgi:acyl-homoserine lactone acylase PvdQ
MRKLWLLLLLPLPLLAQPFQRRNLPVGEKQADMMLLYIQRQTGASPISYGKSDAACSEFVGFSLCAAYAEDDFSRVELNDIEKLGRMAEVKGESELYEDLLVRTGD